MNTSVVEEKITEPIAPFAEAQRIYYTTYKKGAIVGHLHFAHAGDLNSAVEAIKVYLSKKHLKHIHTVPFLIDLNEELVDI